MYQFLGRIVVSFFAGFYNALTLSLLWLWFIVPTFEVAALPYAAAYGITLIFALLTVDRSVIATSFRTGVRIGKEKAAAKAGNRRYIGPDEPEVSDGWNIFAALLVSTVMLILGFFASFLM